MKDSISIGLPLILTGSGIYWVLSSQLISSFTVLLPNAFGGEGAGARLILVVGVVTSAIGLSMISGEFQQLSGLFSRIDGWIFTLPIIFATLDVCMSVAGIRTGQVAELNPLIASAILSGGLAIFSFYISYVALSEGLALMILNLGKSLFGAERSNMFLGFSITCGIAAFGPGANIVILLVGPITGLYFCGGAFSSIISVALLVHFRKMEIHG